VFALVLSVAFGAGDQYLGTLSHHPWGAVRSLSALWLVLPFVVGAVQRDAKRAAILGLACTAAALCGYGLMMLSPVGTHHLTSTEALGYLGNERNVFLASFLTGPLFGWFGWRWRSGRAIGGALVTATALCLEPVVRMVTLKPVRFLDVALAEVAAGFVLVTAMLVRQYRVLGVTPIDERTANTRLGQFGLAFAVLGIIIGGGMLAVILWFIHGFRTLGGI
jgi:hypothetical protein